MAAHQAPPSLGCSRKEHWSGLPFPSPVHESEKWKWSCSVVSYSLWPHGLQPTSFLCPWDFPGKRTAVGCHCLLQGCHLESRNYSIWQAFVSGPRVCTGEDLRFWIFFCVPFPRDENIMLLSYFHCVKFMFILYYTYDIGSHVTIFFKTRYMCACVCVCICSCFSHVWLSATLWTVDPQAPVSMGFSKQGCWSGLPSPHPEHLPNWGIKPGLSSLQHRHVGSLPPGPPGKPMCMYTYMDFYFLQLSLILKTPSGISVISFN